MLYLFLLYRPEVFASMRLEAVLQEARGRFAKRPLASTFFLANFRSNLSTPLPSLLSTGSQRGLMVTTLGPCARGRRFESGQGHLGKLSSNFKFIFFIIED